MTMERLATITKTSPEALKRGAKMSRAPSPGRRAIPEGRGTSRLSERLLTILLKHPEFLAKLDDHRRARLIGLGDTLLGRVVRHLAEQPEADLASLLGYWAGQQGHETLVELADRPLVLKDEALAGEFDDAVTQCLSAVERANRRAFLEVLREEGSAEALAQYWQLKQKAD
jgi:hypothetical protein